MTHWCGKQNSAQIITVTRVSQWCHTGVITLTAKMVLKDTWTGNPLHGKLTFFLCCYSYRYIRLCAWLSYNFPTDTLMWEANFCTNHYCHNTRLSTTDNFSWLRYNFFPKWCIYVNMSSDSRIGFAKCNLNINARSVSSKVYSFLEKGQWEGQWCLKELWNHLPRVQLSVPLMGLFPYAWGVKPVWVVSTKRMGALIEHLGGEVELVPSP